MNESRLIPSVCIDAVFEDKPVAEACTSVKEAGIPAIEFWCWWEKDLDELVEETASRDLAISACCTKFISLVDPALRSAYLEGLAQSIDAAKKLGTKTLISQVGDFLEGVPREDQHASLVEGLQAAAPLVEAADLQLVIEPLNELVNHPGYYLVRSEEAFDIIDEVGSDKIKVIYDIYHQQISEGNLIDTITSNITKIGHFHAAGNPGRHELQRGEIHYPHVFSAIREAGFEGYVGLEYWPQDEDPMIALREVGQWLA